MARRPPRPAVSGAARMLIGFRRQLAPYVEEGSKTCTIRATRKIAPRAGEMCHCYVDARQKSMRLLGRWPCIAVQPVTIDAAHITLDGHTLDEDERNALAWRDGFRPEDSTESAPGEAYTLMFEFFRRRMPFEGTLIEWKFSTSSADSRLPDSFGRPPAAESNARPRSSKAPRNSPAKRR